MSAKELAYYVVVYSKEKGYKINFSKLHKLLYFVQAVYLKVRGVVCFTDDIYASSFGPVVLGLGEDFVSSITLGDTKGINYLSTEDKELISSVIDGLSVYNSSYLLSEVLNHKPWVKAYKSKSNLIDVDFMRFYYNKSESLNKLCLYR